MAKILLSIPDEFLKEIDEHRELKKSNRSQFFIDAIKNYFKKMEEDEYFERKKKAFDRIEQISDEIMSLGIKDWDPVKEIREFRDSRAEELLKRWEEK
jgi:hypothetical protein